jgi:hypothetical protein
VECVLRAIDIQVMIDAPDLSLWNKKLCEVLEKHFAGQVNIVLSSQNRSANHYSALSSLLSLEKMFLRRNKSCWSDRISPKDIKTWIKEPAYIVPNIVIDLTSVGIAHLDVPIYRPLFNGCPGEFGLASALFFDETPQIDIEFIPPSSEQGYILGSGIASLEAASGLGGAMEAVWSRVLILLVKFIGEEPQANCKTTKTQWPQCQSIRYADHYMRTSKNLAKDAARKLYRLCCHSPYWRIGWRKVSTANDVWSNRNLGGVSWNILNDPIDRFYADPVPFYWNSRDYLFFEDFDYKTQKGIISVVVFGNDGEPGEVIPVLEEPWHLSYPFIIEVDGDIWMIPEASLSGKISAYRATNFPFSWEPHTSLVCDVEAADATIVKKDNKYWMFAVTREGVGGYSDTLAIWSANTLLGPWQAHNSNPVVVNDRTARPAGNMIWRDGNLYRPTQDCRNGYGAGLNLARVTKLDDDGFEQVIEASLSPDPSWPGRKLHTLNGNGHIEVIDGSVLRPKVLFAAKCVDQFYKPKV